MLHHHILSVLIFDMSLCANNRAKDVALARALHGHYSTGSLGVMDKSG